MLRYQKFKEKLDKIIALPGTQRIGVVQSTITMKPFLRNIKDKLP
jgi:hypothetical protein